VSEAHALLSASKSEQWYNCPGSLAMSEGTTEQKSSYYADEGTAAHRLAAMCLTDKKAAQAYLGRIITVGEHDFEVTEEMAEHVQTYLDAVDDLRGVGPGRLGMLVEQKVEYHRQLSTPKGTAWGTSDCILVGYSDEEIQVHDFKYGKRVKKYAPGNTQLILYALGAFDALEFLANWKTVRLFIHQPRLDHVSEEKMSIRDLLLFGGRLRKRAGEALDMLNGKVERRLVPGILQCTFCPAFTTCPEAANAALGSALEGFESVDIPYTATAVVKSVPLDMETLESSAYMAAFVEAWAAAVKKALTQAILSGQKSRLFKIVRGKSAGRKWKVLEEVQAFFAAAGIDEKLILTQPELKSPAQLEKVKELKTKVGKAKAALLPAVQEALDKFAVAPEGALTVVPKSDPRPEVEANPGEGFDDVQLDEGV
jgi:hypothetical protein